MIKPSWFEMTRFHFVYLPFAISVPFHLELEAGI